MTPQSATFSSTWQFSCNKGTPSYCQEGDHLTHPQISLALIPHKPKDETGRRNQKTKQK
jgi:hypothetical protein